MSNEPRYRHWIQPASDGKWPTGIFCVDCRSESVLSADSTVKSQERLVSWHGVLLLPDGTDYTVAQESGGETHDGLFAALSDRRIGQRNLWLVSYQCARIWALLGVWQRIEDGTLSLEGCNHRDSAAVRDRLRKYRLAQSDPLRALGGTEASRALSQDSGYLVCEDPPNILRGRIHGTNTSIVWIDVRNYGLDGVGESMPGPETCVYLARLMRRLCFLCRNAGLTALKPTAGSQAMSAWRRSHLKEGVYVHTDRNATGLESKSYCGGRCEAVRIGVVPTPVFHYDIRSCYGWVCANQPLPARLRDYRASECSGDGAKVDHYATSIADVTVETDEPAYPLKLRERVIYPVGRFRTVLCGPELTDALGKGRIRYVHAEASYGMGYCLRSFAEAMYSLRLDEERNGVPGSATWVKRLIVGLPGKLGQRGHRWIDCPDVMPQMMYGEWHGFDQQGNAVRYRSVGGRVQRDSVGGFAADSVPAIAAWVTSVGRMRLLEAIRCADRSNVYYYDTDSLFVNQEGSNRLQAGGWVRHNELGYLTLKSSPRYCEIRGIKYYVEDKKVTCSGLARGNIVDLGDGTHYVRHLTPMEQCRNGQRPEAVVIHGTYPRSSDYNLGTVGPDGTVSPFVFGNGSDEQ